MPFDLFTWPGSVADRGDYPLAPSISNAVVCAPDGNTPTEIDLATHRYRHHTRIASFGGTIFVAFSSAGVNEADPGQQAAMCFSTDGGATWSAPVVIVPAQSDWGTTGYAIGDRAATPRDFEVHDGKLYLICGIDEATAGSPVNHQYTGRALVAREIHADGSVGSLFRISSAAFSPVDGKADIAYDATLGPPLMALSKVYGMWGGSSPAQPQAEWSGFIYDRSVVWAEPSTFPADDSGTNLYRLWRYANRVGVALSQDSGASWSQIYYTGIPNSPSATHGLRLSDGRFAILGNPHDNNDVSRDPLYLALTGVDSVDVEDVYAVRQGLTDVPTYAGTYKHGGASYVSAVEVDVAGTPYLYIAYSLQKESIGFSKLPIPA